MTDNRFYRTVIALLRPLMRLVFPHRVTGLEHIPSDGALILCGNHVSMLDPLFVACATKRPIRFIAKKELFQNRFLSALFTKMGMFPVDRGASDMAALRTCLNILKEGSVLGIYPQGHRWRNDDNHELHSGAVIMALRSRAPIVPIHVSGPVKPFRRTIVRIGAPVDLRDLPRVDTHAIETANSRLGAAIWPEK